MKNKPIWKEFVDYLSSISWEWKSLDKNIVLNILSKSNSNAKNIQIPVDISNSMIGEKYFDEVKKVLILDAKSPLDKFECYSYMTSYGETNIAELRDILKSVIDFEIPHDINSSKHKWNTFYYKVVNTLKGKNTNIVSDSKVNASKNIREFVWQKRNKTFEGFCFVCNRPTSFSNFHLGHIVAVNNGGDDNTNNLEPICSSCNQGMKTMNLYEYKGRYFSGCYNNEIEKTINQLEQLIQQLKLQFNVK